MNIIHEEIRAIQVYMSHLEKAIPLEYENSKKQKLKKDYKELEELLTQKLKLCDDY